jgi:hypothetical protein
MKTENFGIFLVYTAFAFFLVIGPGCSSKEEPVSSSKQENIHELREKVDKEAGRTRNSKHRTYTKAEEAMRTKEMVVADKCMKRYDSCLQGCNSTSCNDECVNRLSVCEKNLPLDLRTVKN